MKPFTTLVTLALLALATTLGAGPTQAAASIPVPEHDPFYAIPGNIAHYADGDVIASRKVSISVLVLPLPAKAWQVKYRTEDRLGRPSATVTTVFSPTATWSGNGPRPLLSYQTPEDGTAGKCAPSYVYRSGLGLDINITYPEIGLITLALQRGWAVSVPDYEGPRSEFLVAGVQAKGVLDGIRAARNFKPAGISRTAPIGLWGYSGGGLATLTAAQWQPSYAPDLKLNAIAAGAPATDIRQSIDALSGSYAGGAVAMGINGFLRAYPGLHLGQYLSKSGRAKVSGAAGDCIANAAVRYPLLRIQDLEASPGALAAPAVARMLRANSPVYINRIPQAPIYHYHAATDELAPIGPARATMRKFCAHGVVVQDVEVPLGEHIAELAIGAPGALHFLADRFAGVKPTNTCTSIHR